MKLYLLCNRMLNKNKGMADPTHNLEVPRTMSKLLQNTRTWTGPYEMYDLGYKFLFVDDPQLPTQHRPNSATTLESLMAADGPGQKVLQTFVQNVQARALQRAASTDKAGFVRQWMQTNRSEYQRWEKLDCTCRSQADVDLGYIAIDRVHASDGAAMVEECTRDLWRLFTADSRDHDSVIAEEGAEMVEELGFTAK